jgi:hypothetical protein
MTARAFPWIALTLAALMLAFVPSIFERYIIFVIYFFLLNVALAQSWNLVGGFTGLVSLGLAPKIIDTIYASIPKIVASGTTVLLIEQNVHRSLEIADRAYILERGRITLSGTAQELAANPDVQAAYFGLEPSH